MRLGGNNWRCYSNCTAATSKENIFRHVRAQHHSRIGDTEPTSCATCQIVLPESQYEDHCQSADHKDHMKKLRIWRNEPQEEEEEEEIEDSQIGGGGIDLVEEDSELPLPEELLDVVAFDDLLEYRSSSHDIYLDNSSIVLGKLSLLKNCLRVPTPSQMAQYLAGFPFDVNKFELPEMREGFNSFCLGQGISRSDRVSLLNYFAEHVGSCKKCDDIPCQHFPRFSEPPKDMFIPIPMVYRDNVVISAGVIVRLSVLYKSWLNDETIYKSLVDSPPLMPRPGTFTNGQYFRQVCQITDSQSGRRLFIAFSLDGVTVTTAPQRTIVAGYATLLNTTLSNLCTIRPFAFFGPVRLSEVPECSDGDLRGLRLLAVQALMDAVCQTGAVYMDSPKLCLKVFGGRYEEFLCILALCKCDSKSHEQLRANRGGSASRCARCSERAEDHAVGKLRQRVLDMDLASKRLGALAKIAHRENLEVTKGKSELQELGLNVAIPFQEKLRFHDARFNSVICSLHHRNLNLTTLMLEVVGRHCFDRTFVKQRGRRKKVKSGGDDHLRIITRINNQYHSYFRPGENLFDEDSGAIALRKRQGKELLEVAMALPFLLFGVLPEEFLPLMHLAVAWRKVVILWRKNDCSELDLEELDRRIEAFQHLMVTLYVVEGDKEMSPWSHPTFHDLQHVTEEKRWFGGDSVTSTQDDEKAHSRYVKSVFLWETNHQKGWEIFFQFWKALWQRGLLFQLAREANPEPLPRGVELFSDQYNDVDYVARVGHNRIGLVSPTVSRPSAVIESLEQKEKRVSFHPDTFGLLFNRCLNAHGHLSFRDFGDVNSISMEVSNTLRINVGSGYRVKVENVVDVLSVIIRPLSHFVGSLAENCVVQLRGSAQFVIVLAVIESCNAALNNVPLFYGKLLFSALVDGLTDPLHNLILLRDGDRDIPRCHKLFTVAEIGSVWSAIFVATPKDAGQLVFIDNKLSV